jgi:hypothetical protein
LLISNAPARSFDFGSNLLLVILVVFTPVDCTYLHRYKKEGLSAVSHRNDLTKTLDEEKSFKFKVLNVILHPDYKETDNGVR